MRVSDCPSEYDEAVNFDVLHASNQEKNTETSHLPNVRKSIRNDERTREVILIWIIYDYQEYLLYFFSGFYFVG